MKVATEEINSNHSHTTVISLSSSSWFSFWSFLWLSSNL